ncbi:MAG TPA: hypothetical protein VFY29_01700 [Terriglobia bacterium]|nr:hypothetical protein [Terriglobia bacterium]
MKSIANSSRHRRGAAHIVRPGLFALLVLSFAGRAAAQTSTVGASVNMVGGASDPHTSGPGTFSAFGAVYPSVTLSTVGQKSSFGAGYTFGFDRSGSSLAQSSNSHAATAQFTSQATPRWTLRFSESYELTKNASAFYALQAVIPEGGSGLVFYPVALRLSTATNTAGADVSYTASEKSSWSFGGTHSLRNYGASAGGVHGTLSNQQTVQGHGSYSRQVSERSAWTIRYTGEYSTFRDFNAAQSHMVSLQFSRRLTPNVTLNLSGGGSRVASVGTTSGYSSYDVSGSLERTLKNASYTIYFTRETGRSSGLGSISDTERAGFSLRRDARAVLIFVDVGAFDTRGRFENVVRTVGGSAAASVGARLSRYAYFRVGSQFQRYGQSAEFSFSEQRIFASLQFNNPTLWRL